MIYRDPRLPNSVKGLRAPEATYQRQARCALAKPERSGYALPPIRAGVRRTEKPP